MATNYSPNGPVLSIDADSAIVQGAAAIAYAVTQQQASALDLSGQLYQWLMSWLQLLGREAAVPDDIAAAQAYALRHLSEDIGVDQLSRAAGLSRHHFSRRFSEAVGEAPGQWLQRQRLELAARLLAGEQSIPDIAAHCGFSSQSYFGKAFKKCWGVSPAVYRRRIG